MIAPLWLWVVTVVVILLAWWYKSLKRYVRYQQWRRTYLPWLDEVEEQRVKFDPTWPDVPSG